MPPALWDFALTIYDRPEIAAQCLHLQDEFGFDVNMLLWCLWHGRYFGVMDQTLLKEALAFSEPWQREVVAPLRRTRRWLKQQLAAESGDASLARLREQVKNCELAGERHQLERLEALVQAAGRDGPGHSDYRVAATCNLAGLKQTRSGSDVVSAAATTVTTTGSSSEAADPRAVETAVENALQELVERCCAVTG